MLKLTGGSALHRNVTAHFDVIWDLASIPAEQVRRDYADGVDRGLHQSGIVNIFTDPRRARERMIRLIDRARHRIWIQGVSLYPMLMSPMTRALDRAIRRGGIDIRLLILNPDSDQARYKTFQEYAANSPDGDTAESWLRYRSDPDIHRRSQLYHNIRESIRRSIELGRQAEPSHYQVRTYESAPGAYVFVVDDRVLVEQYHYAAAPREHRSPLELAEEMPLVEYHMPRSDVFGASQRMKPLEILQHHFDFVFGQLAEPAQPAD
jgi:hypothetical protein